MARLKGGFLTELRSTDPSSRNRSGGFPSVHFSGTMTETKIRFLSLRIVKFFKAVTQLLSHAPARAYGLSAVSFGAVTLLLYFLKLSADLTTVTPILGAVIAFLAIPFLLSDKTLPLLLQDFAVTDYIFFEFFCIKRTNKNETARRIPPVLSVLLGVAVALFGIVYPARYISIGAWALIFVYVTLLSPEFAFFASFLALPYMSFVPYSAVIFSVLIVLTVFSFLRKSFFGKRVFYIDGYDLIIGLLMLTLLISGIFIKGFSSFTQSLGMIFMGFGYTISNNVVTNRRLADRAANSIVISSVPPAIVSIALFVRSIAVGAGTALIDKGVFFAFSSGEASAVFLLVASVFAIAMMKQSHGSKKVFYAVVLFIDVLTLILTGEAFAVLALVIGVIAHRFIRAKHGSVVFVLLLATVPYLALLLLPSSVLDAVFSVIPSLESANSLFTLWSESLSAFVSNIVFGIGIGAESFAEEMAGVGVIGSNSSNLFIELGLEAGFFAVGCFAVLLLVRLFHRASYRSYVKISDVSTFAPLCSVCVFCIVAYGAVSYIFQDMFASYLFWCVFGIGSAALRVAKRETDDRNHYYEDTRASDSSAIDVEIR